VAGDTPALGALLGVVELLNEQFDTIEADFQRFYGLDLGEACWGDNHVGVRRLMALIRGLPPESTLSRVTGDWWTEGHELTASLVELTHAVAQASQLSAQTGWAQVAGKKQFPKPDPLKIPRPGDSDVQVDAELPELSLSETRSAFQVT